MKILFVTSFAKDMYNVTGEKLIKSYIDTKSFDTGDLLVCYENFDFNKTKYIDHPNIKSHNLNKNEFLKTWLHKNKDIIPTSLGGSATSQQKPGVFSEWNRKASRWFRKIVSLDVALSYTVDTDIKAEYDTIVWLDSDCIILNQLSEQLFISAFNNCDIFYHMGKYRTENDFGVESSIIGFTGEENGFNLLEKVIEHFKSGKFRKERRWDDGWIFRIFISKYKNEFKMNDLVKDKFKSSHVISKGIFKQYIKHDKGIHKIYKIMN
jgi:hypothetical protein